MGKWELIIALAIFAVNGVLGYLAKREKEKARRQAEAEAAGLPTTNAPIEERVPTRPPAPADLRVDPRSARGGANQTPPAPPVPARAKRPVSRPAKSVPQTATQTARGPARGGTTKAPIRKPAPGVGTPKGMPNGPATRSPKAAPPAATTVRISAERPPVSAASAVPVAVRRDPSVPVTSPADRMRQGLRDPRSLRSAVIWAEVLGRPRGLDPSGGTPVF